MDFEEYGPVRDAEINRGVSHDADPIEGARQTALPMPILDEDLALHWRDIELSKELGAPHALDGAAGA